MRWRAGRGATSDWGIQEAWDEGSHMWWEGQGPAGGDAPVNPITEISQLAP